MEAQTEDGDPTISGGGPARSEAGQMGDREQLRELHDSYAWEVNAAVGEGRLDLVWQLADQYVDEALELITGAEQPGCGRTDCSVCDRPHPARAPARRRRWSRCRWSRRQRGAAAS
jgi:hypothetical protein